MPFFLKCFSHFKFVDHTSLASPHLSGHSFLVSFTGSSFSSTKPFLGAAHGSAFSLLLLFICTHSYGFKHHLHANNSLLQPQPRSLLPCSMSPCFHLFLLYPNKTTKAVFPLTCYVGTVGPHGILSVRIPTPSFCGPSLLSSQHRFYTLRWLDCRFLCDGYVRAPCPCIGNSHTLKALNHVSDFL